VLDRTRRFAGAFEGLLLLLFSQLWRAPTARVSIKSVALILLPPIKPLDDPAN